MRAGLLALLGIVSLGASAPRAIAQALIVPVTGTNKMVYDNLQLVRTGNVYHGQEAFVCEFNLAMHFGPNTVPLPPIYALCEATGTFDATGAGPIRGKAYGLVNTPEVPWTDLVVADPKGSGSAGMRSLVGVDPVTGITTWNPVWHYNVGMNGMMLQLQESGLMLGPWPNPDGPYFYEGEVWGRAVIPTSKNPFGG